MRFFFFSAEKSSVKNKSFGSRLMSLGLNVFIDEMIALEFANF